MDSGKISKLFVGLVGTSSDTPHLIQRIAEQKDYMKCCAAAVKAKNNDDPELFRLYRVLQKEARLQGISWDRLIVKLTPVAVSLGIYTLDDIQADYYQILGISSGADAKSIKKAYREKARQTHPDIQYGHNEQFLTIHEAYEVLSNPVRREQYDLKQKHLKYQGWSEFSEPQAEQETGNGDFSGVSFRRHVYSLGVILLLFVFIAVIADMLIQQRSLENDFPLVAQKSETVASPSLTEISDTFVSDTKKDSIDSYSKNIKQITSKKEGISERKPLKKPLKKIDKSLDRQKDKPVLLVAHKSETVASPSLTETSDTFNSDTKKDSIDSYSKNIKQITSKKEGTSESKPLKKIVKSLDRQKDKPVLLVEVPDIPKRELLSETAIGQYAKTKPKKLYQDSISKWMGNQQSDSKKKSMDLTRQLNAFLSRYCQVYEHRNLDQFMNLFTENAKENGKPIQQLLPTYRKNFQIIDAIEYKIDIASYARDFNLDRIQVEGSFFLKWMKKHSDQWHQYNGIIRMTLIRHEDSFRVQQLNYQFSR